MNQLRSIDVAVWPVKAIDESGVTDAVQINLITTTGEGFVMTLTADDAIVFGMSLIQVSEAHNVPAPED